MLDQIVSLLTPQIAVTLLAAIAAFATTLTLLMPVLSRDRLSTRMQVMATERDKMRAARLADLGKKDGQGLLRSAPKGYMQEIVDKLNLRSVFETEEVRDTLKMAGLRGQAPLVTYSSSASPRRRSSPPSRCSICSSSPTTTIRPSSRSAWRSAPAMPASMCRTCS
jgi:hypothetical protein